MFLARIWVRVRKIIAWKEGKAVETVIDGLKIRYIDQGSGTPVLLLHGWGVEASVYHLIIDHLSARYRVVAPDLPGFGGSQEPDRPWDSTDFAAFVEKFAAAVQVRDPVLIGHSNGGRIILRLASRPEAALRAKKIVLIDSAGLPGPSRPGILSQGFRVQSREGGAASARRTTPFSPGGGKVESAARVLRLPKGQRGHAPDNGPPAP